MNKDEQFDYYVLLERHLKEIEERVRAAVVMARESGDEKLEKYNHGILKGLRLAGEALAICWHECSTDKDKEKEKEETTKMDKEMKNECSGGSGGSGG